MRPLPHTRSCFVCGEANPIGLKLRLQTDGRSVHTQFTLRPEHAGFKGIIHGGLLATLLDEVMVWACAVQTRRFAYCAELNVRFLLPARPDEELSAQAEMIDNRRDKIFEAKGEIKDASGRVLAAATGKYMPVKEGDVAKLARDLVVVGDRQWLLK